MARPSSIDRLPAPIRDKVGALRQAGATIDEILDHLNRMDVEVSRSAMGRHVQKIDKIGEQLRASRAMAEALVRGMDEQDADSKLARLNIEMMHTIIQRIAMGEDGNMPALDPKEAQLLTRAITNLETAATISDERMRKLEAAWAKKAAALAETVATKHGLSDQGKAALKAEFLGLAERS
jgi:hypothetical protein